MSLSHKGKMSFLILSLVIGCILGLFVGYFLILPILSESKSAAEKWTLLGGALAVIGILVTAVATRQSSLEAAEAARQASLEAERNQREIQDKIRITSALASEISSLTFVFVFKEPVSPKYLDGESFLVTFGKQLHGLLRRQHIEIKGTTTAFQSTHGTSVILQYRSQISTMNTEDPPTGSTFGQVKYDNAGSTENVTQLDSLPISIHLRGAKKRHEVPPFSSPNDLHSASLNISVTPKLADAICRVELISNATKAKAKGKGVVLFSADIKQTDWTAIERPWPKDPADPNGLTHQVPFKYLPNNDAPWYIDVGDARLLEDTSKLSPALWRPYLD